MPVDAWTSTTLNTFVGGSFRGGAGFWTSGAGGLRMVNNYVYSIGVSCITLYDTGVQKWAPVFDTGCEGPVQSAFRLSGPNTAPTYTDFRFRGYHQASVATFSTDGNITSVSMPNAGIELHYNSPVIPMFSAARLWTMSGQVAVHNPGNWNAPAAFQGRLTVSGNTTPPGLGPVDIFPGAAGAWSAARQLNRSYTGPLIQVQRASDSAVADIYPNAFGDTDKAVAGLFCSATTCSVTKLYDQSGNANHFTQNTAASQPTLNIANAALGGRASMAWSTSAALTAPSSSTLDNLFASGGYATFAVNQGSNALVNRLMSKLTGNGGWEIRANSGAGTPFSFLVGSANGSWVSGTPLTSAAHVYDVQYNSSSQSNAPSLGVDGVAQSLASTQPANAISSDAGVPLIFGNSAATGGTRGFIGQIGEAVIWKSIPNPAQVEAMRRNQAAYYSISGVR